MSVISEELARSGASGVGFPMHTDIVAPYLLGYGTEEQKRRWLPGMAAGTAIAALAMTEPGAGSDVTGIATTAARDGDHWVLRGQKTFVTNGINADLVLVAARTGPDPYTGLSLFVAERGAPGFTRGRNLDKIGMHAQDTAELFFDDARLPAGSMLGEQGQGFGYLMEHLTQERLVVTVGSVAMAEEILDQTIGYCQQRTAFGRPIAAFQNSRFALAEMRTEVDIARVFTDWCIASHVRGEFGATEAAKAKWWTTDLLNRVVDRCLQLHGGYGYMREYPISRLYADARVTRIFGGTSEVMKSVISKSLAL